MSGVIDRIDRLATGALSIVDIKTGALKGEIAMRMTFPKFAAAVAEGQLWVKAMPAVQPQLALYRHAKPQAASLAYLYLGARPKAKDYRDDASADSIDCAADADVLDALQAALSEIFFTPWAAGTLTAVAPTRYARTCRRCDFIRVCPGYLEEDD
jgi:RecB family exonuclease